MGLEASRHYAAQLLAQALASLDKVDKTSLHGSSALRALADMLVNRQH
jgi:farnesyl diphosphate synthase